MHDFLIKYLLYLTFKVFTILASFKANHWNLGMTCIKKNFVFFFFFRKFITKIPAHCNFTK